LDARAAAGLGGEPEAAAQRLRSLTHAHEPEAADAGVPRIEARAVVGDPQQRAVPVRELDRDVLRSSVAARVRDRLADDANEGLALVGRHLRAPADLDTELDADA